MEDMQKLMRGETSQAAEKDKPKAKVEKPGDPGSPSGYPNPLGLTLLDCHLPERWIRNKKSIMDYCLEHFTMNQMQSVSVNEQEMDLYAKYAAACRDAGIPPITSRYFATAIRCIAAGMPIQKATPLQLKDLQL